MLNDTATCCTKGMEKFLQTLNQNNVQNIHTAKMDFIRKIFGDGVIKFKGACMLVLCFILIYLQLSLNRRSAHTKCYYLYACANVRCSVEFQVVCMLIKS